MIDDICEIEPEIRYDFLLCKYHTIVFLLSQTESISGNLLQLIRASSYYSLILITFLNACLSLEKKFSPSHNMMQQGNSFIKEDASKTQRSQTHRHVDHYRLHSKHSESHRSTAQTRMFHSPLRRLNLGKKELEYINKQQLFVQAFRRFL